MSLPKPEQDYQNYADHVYRVDLPTGRDKLLERLREFHPEHDPTIDWKPKCKDDTSSKSTDTGPVTPTE